MTLISKERGGLFTKEALIFLVLSFTASSLSVSLEEAVAATRTGAAVAFVAWAAAAWAASEPPLFSILIFASIQFINPAIKLAMSRELPSSETSI
jgi:hypothetical protein